MPFVVTVVAMEPRQALAQRIAAKAKPGETIGIGTGTTVDVAIDALAARVASEKLSIHVVPTSHASAWRLEERGLTVLDQRWCGRIDWAFDGADEVDRDRRLIKGRGGAMLAEKIMAARAERFIVIVDEAKLVNRLGERFPIPVEVVPYAVALVTRELMKNGASHVALREGSGKHGAVVTEQGNVILDAQFPAIPSELEERIGCIPGVVESGLFVGWTDEVLVASEAGARPL